MTRTRSVSVIISHEHVMVIYLRVIIYNILSYPNINWNNLIFININIIRVITSNLFQHQSHKPFNPFPYFDGVLRHHLTRYIGTMTGISVIK